MLMFSMIISYTTSFKRHCITNFLVKKIWWRTQNLLDFKIWGPLHKKVKIEEPKLQLNLFLCKVNDREMKFVQQICDNFLSHTHIMFLLYLSIALVFVLISTFFVKIYGCLISCQATSPNNIHHGKNMSSINQCFNMKYMEIIVGAFSAITIKLVTSLPAYLNFKLQSWDLKKHKEKGKTKGKLQVKKKKLKMKLVYLQN